MLLLKESGESLQESTVNNTLKVVYFIFSHSTDPQGFFSVMFQHGRVQSFGL